jgi:hypothetical protein
MTVGQAFDQPRHVLGGQFGDAATHRLGALGQEHGEQSP